MPFHKDVCRVLFVLMLAMQVALAQHASVHFLEGAHNGPVHQQQDRHQPDKDKLCQLCLLSKDFAKILTPAGPDIMVPVHAVIQTAAFLESVAASGNPSPYTARAPPAFSA